MMSEKGFSLLEIMIVIALIALLSGITGVAVMKLIDGGRKDAAATQMKNLETALALYKHRCGQYPSTVEGLRALVEPVGTCKNWMPLLDSDTVPADPWDRPYAYFSPAQTPDRTYEIICRGSSLEDPTDDLVSYSKM